MESAEEYTRKDLENCSYRFLQQSAKKMGLPSNVKKIYLIQLIQAKKNSTPEDLEFLVEQVRKARQHTAVARKNINSQTKAKKKIIQHQSTEISSTSNTRSPPISVTPKRKSHYVIRYSPDYQPKIPKIKTTSTFQNILSGTSKSDRILRSFKAVKKPNCIMNNSLIGVIKSSSFEDRNEQTLNIVSKAERYQKLNVQTYVNRKAENRNSRELVPATRSMNISPPTSKRQRTISGIYPLNCLDDIKIPNVIVRRPDGRLSKINAIIQNPVKHSDDRSQNTINMDFNKNVTMQNLNDGISDMLQSSNYDDVFKENSVDQSEYFHKKIRAEQIRSQRCREVKEPEERLPRIGEVFSKFNPTYRKDLMQPIYVQVSNESELAANTPFAFKPEVANTMMLEKLYNLKNVFLVNQPLLQICTTTSTKCVYSTSLRTTAKPQPSVTPANNYNTVSVPHDFQYHGTQMEAVPRAYDIFSTFPCDEEGTYMSRSCSSLETTQSQELGANVTIPEMVEDALELISQDGDYMERMGMDIRMQCILCQWAGPKIILEYHIRKEHSSEVVKEESDEWSSYYSLGGLVRGGLWRSRLAERDSQLFVLSAQYQLPDCFMATLSTLSSEEDPPRTGRITIYNKVTGEPYSWEGEIQQLPPSLPYENNTNCLKIELSRLNLLPNSANLKLMNGELVMNSSNKVVIGQPELDNIYIMVTVQLLN